MFVAHFLSRIDPHPKYMIRIDQGYSVTGRGGLQSTKNYTYNYVNSTTKLITPREKYCSNLIAHTFYWVPSQSSFSNSLYCPFCFPDRIHICPVPISINCNYFICKIKKVEKKLPVKPAHTVHVATMWTYFATESTQQQQLCRHMAVEPAQFIMSHVLWLHSSGP